MLTLYTFAISHFSEKVRWAMDRAGLTYREQLLLPGVHMLTTRRLSSETSVPILRDGDRIVQGSSAILDYLAAQHGAADCVVQAAERATVDSWEQTLDTGFGLGLQQLFYASATGADAHLARKLWAHGSPWWGEPLYAVTYPVFAAVARRMYSAHRPGTYERAAERCDRVLDQVGQQLARQPFMQGEGPGRVDFTLAALLAPMVAPPEHPVPWPGLPARLGEFVRARKDHPAMQHTMRMYRDHRHAGAPYRLATGGLHEV